MEEKTRISFPNILEEKRKYAFLTTNMEEKHTFAYKKLVVPMAMRSIYWRYFGFPATDDGDILTKVKIVCVLCKTQIAYNRNTSNLRLHLQNKHPKELMELEVATPPRRIKPEIKDKRLQRKPLMKTPTAIVNGSVSPYIYTTSADGTVQIGGDIRFITDTNIDFQSIEDESGTQNVHVVLKTDDQNEEQNVAILLPNEASTGQTVASISEKAISDAIVELIVMDLHSTDIVEGKGFQRFISSLRGPYERTEIPSKIKLETEIIPKLYASFKEEISSILANVSCEVGLSIEEWMSANGETFITFSVHYQQTVESSLETKVLRSVHCGPDFDSNHWSVILDEMFAEWNIISGRVTAAVIATNQQDLLIALGEKGIVLVPCLVHSLQVCVCACFEYPEISTVLNKCRCILSAVERSPSASSALGLQEAVLQGKSSEECSQQIEDLNMDYPRVWTSTYMMLEQVLLRKSAVCTALDHVNDVEKELFMLSEADWHIIEDVVMVLEPFKVTILTLSEERIPLVSLLKPLLWQLNSAHLKIKETDSDMARMLKETLSDYLTDKYSEPSVTSLLHTATALDPRFKLLPYESDEEKNIVSDELKALLLNLIESDMAKECNSSEDLIPNKKSRISGMELLLGDIYSVKTEVSSDERINLELIQYQTESTAPLDHCPLQWWSKSAVKFPNLAKLARRFNCVAASAMPSNRISLEHQVSFDLKRANLTPGLADKLLFLHSYHC